MDGAPLPEIDYQAAAERLLVVLSAIHAKVGARAIPAVSLVRHVFRGHWRKWSRETQRRRIRDVTKAARQLLVERGRQLEIVANGSGIWIDGDDATLREYASRRRRRGLSELATAGSIKRTAVAMGQPQLF